MIVGGWGRAAYIHHNEFKARAETEEDTRFKRGEIQTGRQECASLHVGGATSKVSLYKMMGCRYSHRDMQKQGCREHTLQGGFKIVCTQT